MHEMLEMHILKGHEQGMAKPDCNDLALAEAYVPSQPLDCIFQPEEGLMMGTAFPNLYRPYKGFRRMPEC